MECVGIQTSGFVIREETTSHARDCFELAGDEFFLSGGFKLQMVTHDCRLWRFRRWSLSRRRLGRKRRRRLLCHVISDQASASLFARFDFLRRKYPMLIQLIMYWRGPTKVTIDSRAINLTNFTKILSVNVTPQNRPTGGVVTRKSRTRRRKFQHSQAPPMRLL